MQSIARPGARNLITDVPGLRVGQSADERVRSGVTVILPDEPAVCACAVAGGAPGTRETDAITPDTIVEAVDGVVLSGGSVYGLAAAEGVVAWLGAQGRGFRFAGRPDVPPAPVVPAAILFDLANGGDKAFGLDPPYRRLGVEAAEAAGHDFALGTAGAGYGAMAGALKGGTGSASITSGGITVGALVAVNSFGSVIAGDGRTFWAAPFEIGAEFGGMGTLGLAVHAGDFGLAKPALTGLRNTTLACIATDATLTPAQARRVALMAQAGLARAIRPVFAPFDGDVVFVISTAKLPPVDPLGLTRLGALATDVLTRAVARGVYEAAPWPATEVPVWRDLR